MAVQPNIHDAVLNNTADSHWIDLVLAQYEDAVEIVRRARGSAKHPKSPCVRLDNCYLRVKKITIKGALGTTRRALLILQCFCTPADGSYTEVRTLVHADGTPKIVSCVWSTFPTGIAPQWCGLR